MNELLGVELISDALVLRHIVEQREDLLSTRVRRKFILLLELALHEKIKHLGFVLHEDLILLVLRDGVQESDDAFVQLHLVVVGEVDDHGVVDRLRATQMLVQCQLFDVHHVGQAEERVDVDAWLQILGESESLFDELD